MTTAINRESAEARLTAALLDLGIEQDGITSATQLRADLDIDSAELVELVASMSDGRAPDSKALKEVRTVGQLVDFIERNDI